MDSIIEQQKVWMCNYLLLCAMYCTEYTQNTKNKLYIQSETIVDIFWAITAWGSNL